MQKELTDKVFSALADKNRRKVVEILHQKEVSIMEISSHFPISFQALSKHVAILEEAGIVEKHKRGKFVICSLKQEALKQSLEWISYYSDFWNDSFNKLDNLIRKQEIDEK